MSLRFWPARRVCQARSIGRDGAVHVDRMMDLDTVIDGLLKSLGKMREAR